MSDSWRDVPCKLWTKARSARGYGRTYKYGKQHYAHKLTWEDANGTVPAGMVVAHRCDNPPCYELAHLFLTTQAGNIADMKAKGRDAKSRRRAAGADIHSDALVVDARRRYANGETLVSIAQGLGITRQAVFGWVHGLSRREAGGPMYPIG